MNKLKQLVKRLVYGYKADSKSYEAYLKKIGVDIGGNFKIYCPSDTIIDTQNPYLIKIGHDVSMTGPVTILTHDYSWAVFKRMDGRILGNQKPVIIGNNVFIGWGATLLGGTVIGDNVVIGAGSVVSSQCESNAVYAGVPAKRIMSIEELMVKREQKQLEEAQLLYRFYYERYNTSPPLKLFDSYFPLFTSSDNYEEICKEFKDRIELEGNAEQTRLFLKNVNENLFSSYDEFEQSIKYGQRG